MSSWKRKFYRIEWYWSLGRLLCLQPLTWQDVKIEIDSIKGITYVYSRHMNICRDFTKTRSGEEEEEKEKHFIKILFRNAQCIANGRETLAARCFHSERNHSAWTQHHMANNQQQARHAKLKKRGGGRNKRNKTSRWEVCWPEKCYVISLAVFGSPRFFYIEWALLKACFIFAS